MEKVKIEENSLNQANKSTDEGAARLLHYIAPGCSSLCVHFDPFRIASRWDGRSAAAFLPPYLNSLIPNYETYRDAGSRTFGARFKREPGGPVGLNERKTSNATYSRARETSFPFSTVHYLEYHFIRKCEVAQESSLLCLKLHSFHYFCFPETVGVLVLLVNGLIVFLSSRGEQLSHCHFTINFLIGQFTVFSSRNCFRGDFRVSETSRFAYN